ECLQTPVLAYQAHLLEGQIAHARNDRQTAHQAYSEARKALETLRSRLQGEELKISFVKNRMQVYEALVDLYISGDGTDTSSEEAFGCMEAAKSRSMIEMILQSCKLIFHRMQPLSNTLWPAIASLPPLSRARTSTFNR